MDSPDGRDAARMNLPCSVWCVKHKDGCLGEIAAQYDIEGDAPLRMAVSQGRDFLLLAMGFGGLMRINMDLSATPPILTCHIGEACPSSH